MIILKKEEIKMFSKLKRKKFNYALLIIVIIMMSFGVIMVNSANSSYTKKNILGTLIALTIMVIFAFIDYRKYFSMMWVIYIVNLFMLVLVKVPYIGYTYNGATRWIKIANIQFQPSEISKVLLILFVASYISKKQEKILGFKTLLTLVVLIMPHLILIVTQPDLSTTIVTFMVILTIIFIGGLSLKFIGITSAILIPITTVLIWYIQQPWQKLLRSWQQRRVLSFLHPQDYIGRESYQQFNSMLAIGSGKLWGNGLNNNLPSSVKNASYLPEPQTDFIFSIIGEDLGFIGTVFTIILFVILICILFKISRKITDNFAKLIVGGAIAYIGIQSFINIGVVTLLLPNTGLPLPFISYGLSSLFSSCILMGICLNISSYID